VGLPGTSPARRPDKTGGERGQTDDGEKVERADTVLIGQQRERVNQDQQHHIDPSQPYVGRGSLGPHQDDGGDDQGQHRSRDMQAAEDTHLVPTPFVIIG
jgi:hypothetical protein